MKKFNLKKSQLVIWSIAILVVCLIAYLLFRPQLTPLQNFMDGVIAWIDGLGFWGPVIFIILYIASAIFLIPGSVMTASAGTLFGVGMGSLYVSIASTIGATLSFLIGRYLARK